MKVLKVPNRKGERLVGALHGALGDKLVIICHGLADTKDDPVFVHLAEQLEEHAPVFRFDFSGNGESQGRFEDATYHKEVGDLEDVMEYFTRLGVEGFCLIGHSMGGGVVQKVAPRKDVKALVSLAGVSRAESFEEKFPELVHVIQMDGRGYVFAERFGERFPITEAYLDSARSIDILAAAPHVRCPVLAVQGSEDSLMREEHTREWLGKLPHGEWRFEIIDGASHFFNRDREDLFFEEALQSLRELVVPWVEECF